MPIVASIHGELRGIVLSLLLVAATTAIMWSVHDYIDFSNKSAIYLIPIIAAATRWGMASAIVAAIASIVATIFFFYHPIYRFEVATEQQAVNLILFIFVAVVTSRLASTLKRQAGIARQREINVSDLYAFSRRLAAAPTAADIYTAIQDHLSTVIQHEVVLLGTGSDDASNVLSGGMTVVPERVHAAAAEAVGQNPSDVHGKLVDDGDGNGWLVRQVAPKTPAFGVIAINLGETPASAVTELRQRVDAVLVDAAATLERLDIARAINDARMRAETDLLREALIGSVSHELRTPLSAILGAATVLGNSPALAQDERLGALVSVVREEAERLNNDIQNLLDATRISREGIRPHLEWTEPVDIVNSALARRGPRLAGYTLALDIEHDLPLVYVDPVLVEQALMQILDNAAKYSPPGSTIAVTARQRDDAIELAVGDQGVGLTADEQAHLGERFFRGQRHVATVAGSGLGLWIANSFIAANNGRLRATSEGEGRGATISIELPAPQDAMLQTVGSPDD